MAEPESEDRPLSWRERIALWLSKVQMATYTMVVVVLLALGLLWPRIFITVPSGHRAVMYRFFRGGTVTDRIWGEGLHIIPPWDRLIVYEIRLQQEDLKMQVLSEEGLDLGLALAVRYRPNKDMLGYLHHDIGPGYFNRLIKPEVEAHVRRTMGRRAAHEIYASSGDLLQELAQTPALGRLETPEHDAPARPYVEILELRLVDVNLPDVVTAAIAEKYRQEQLMLEYRYKLEREEKEAERKRTEAAGIRDYNLIAGKVSHDLLRWRGIDATLELAKSQNTKVVMLGGGQGGTPMIVNLDGMGPDPADKGAAPADTGAAPVPAAGSASAAPAPAAGSASAAPTARPSDAASR